MDTVRLMLLLLLLFARLLLLLLLLTQMFHLARFSLGREQQYLYASLPGRGAILLGIIYLLAVVTSN